MVTEAISALVGIRGLVLIMLDAVSCVWVYLVLEVHTNVVWPLAQWDVYVECLRKYIYLAGDFWWGLEISTGNLYWEFVLGISTRGCLRCMFSQN
jgi:hypothetical protein